MKNLPYVLGNFFLGFLVVVISGCAIEPKEPIYLDPAFAEKNICEFVVVLPVFDARKDRSVEIDVNKIVRPYVKEILEDKNYEVLLVSDFGKVANITYDDIEIADPTWINSLGPDDAKWVLLLTLEDLTSVLTFGSAASAEMHGILFDKLSGSIIWKDKGIGRGGQGGILGMLIKGLVTEGAIKESVSDLIRSFPENRPSG